MSSRATDMPGLMIPPHSVEAEQSLLGALLLDNRAWERIADLVSIDDFYRDDHRRIFRHIGKLIESGRAADVVTLAEALDKDLERAGGVSYLGSLSQNAPGSINARRYAEIVADRAKKRKGIEFCARLTEDLLSPAARPVSQILEDAQEQLFALDRRAGAESAKPFNQILAKVMESVDQRYHSDGGGITGVATGFVDLDDKLAGLQRGDLIVIAGRPSMGKTALAMNMVEHVAVELGQPVLVLSLEMADTQLGQRMLGSNARIDQHALRTGRLSDEDWSKLSRSMGKLHDAPIIIEETFDLSPASLRSKARRADREHGRLGLIVLDYLQLMEGGPERRVDAIAEISRGLKRIAKELDVPVVALSQLNRGVEQRPNKRPGMADLRDSGAIEQDADVILFMYRDEVYHEETANRGVAEVIIGKQRNGPIGTIYLAFLAAFTRFENYAGEPPRSAPAKPRSRAFEPPPHRADIDG